MTTEKRSKRKKGDDKRLGRTPSLSYSRLSLTTSLPPSTPSLSPLLSFSSQSSIVSSQSSFVPSQIVRPLVHTRHFFPDTAGFGLAPVDHSLPLSIHHSLFIKARSPLPWMTLYFWGLTLPIKCGNSLVCPVDFNWRMVLGYVQYLGYLLVLFYVNYSIFPTPNKHSLTPTNRIMNSVARCAPKSCDPLIKNWLLKGSCSICDKKNISKGVRVCNRDAC